MCLANVDKNVGDFFWFGIDFELFENRFGLLQT